MDQHAHEQPWCRLHDPLSSAMLAPDEGRPYAVSNKSVGCTKCWAVRPSRIGPSLSISNTQGKDTHWINCSQLWVPISGRSCHIVGPEAIAISFVMKSCLDSATNQPLRPMLEPFRGHYVFCRIQPSGCERSHDSIQGCRLHLKLLKANGLESGNAWPKDKGD